MSLLQGMKQNYLQSVNTQFFTLNMIGRQFWKEHHPEVSETAFGGTDITKF